MVTVSCNHGQVRFATFAALPQVGVYKHLNAVIKPFKEQLLENTDREYTLSGIGSLIDYDRYGLNIKRPSPQLNGSRMRGLNSSLYGAYVLRVCRRRC